MCYKYTFTFVINIYFFIKIKVSLKYFSVFCNSRCVVTAVSCQITRGTGALAALLSKERGRALTPLKHPCFEVERLLLLITVNTEFH